MTQPQNPTFLSQVDGFIPVIDVLAQELGLMESVVYGIVWRYCQQKNRVCYASLETIAGHAHISRQTVYRHITHLCKEGYLEDKTPDRKDSPHVYADTGKAKIFGLVGAVVGIPESHTGIPESPTKQPFSIPESHTSRVQNQDSKEESNNGASAPPPSSPLTRQLTALWGKKRVNSSQAAIITGLETAYPYDKVIEAATWAHAKDMAFGAALLSIKKALPNWGNNGNGGNSGKRRNGTNSGRIQSAPRQHQIADPAGFDPIVPDGTAGAPGG